MSRSRGAEAIVLREATRRAGVTARAAYRHFADRDAVVRAVAQAALAEMARTIEQKQADVKGGRAMLRGVGQGYIQFALDEPGWFDVAFFAMGDMLNSTAVESAGDAGRSPYQQLEDALARLVSGGSSTPTEPGTRPSLAGQECTASLPSVPAARCAGCHEGSWMLKPRG